MSNYNVISWEFFFWLGKFLWNIYPAKILTQENYFYFLSAKNFGRTSIVFIANALRYHIFLGKYEIENLVWVFNTFSSVILTPHSLGETSRRTVLSPVPLDKHSPGYPLAYMDPSNGSFSFTWIFKSLLEQDEVTPDENINKRYFKKYIFLVNVMQLILLKNVN